MKSLRNFFTIHNEYCRRNPQLEWCKSFADLFVITHSVKDAEIYVIDNGSIDDSLTYLKNNHLEIRTISLEKNLGFAGGYNEGLKQINAEYFVIVNSDIEVTKNWIPPLIEVLKNNNSISAIQPKILPCYFCKII